MKQCDKVEIFQRKKITQTYKVYLVFIDFEKVIEMLIFGVTFEDFYSEKLFFSGIVVGKNWLEVRTKLTNQVKLVQTHETIPRLNLVQGGQVRLCCNYPSHTKLTKNFNSQILSTLGSYTNDVIFLRGRGQGFCDDRI